MGAVIAIFPIQIEPAVVKNNFGIRLHTKSCPNFACESEDKVPEQGAPVDIESIALPAARVGVLQASSVLCLQLSKQFQQLTVDGFEIFCILAPHGRGETLHDTERSCGC